MNENERIIIEATLEELKRAEDDAKHYIGEMVDDRSHEIILAAIRYFIEAREMYGED